jgi:hypothetical protein
MNSESLPAVAVGSTILKLGTKSLNMNKVLVAVLVLNGWLSTPWNVAYANRSPPYIVQESQCHRICHIGTQSSSGSEDPEIECEVLNPDISLADLANAGVDGYTRNGMACSSRNHPRIPSARIHTSEKMDLNFGTTHPCRAGQVGCHLRQVVDRVGCKLAVIFRRIRAQYIILDRIRTGCTSKERGHVPEWHLVGAYLSGGRSLPRVAP